MNITRLNSLINHAVYKIDSLFSEKGYPQYLLDNLYLISIGMIIKYGDDYEPRIYDTISSIRFLIRDIKLNNDEKLYFKGILNNNLLYRCLNENSTDKNIDFDYQLVVSKVDDSDIKTLEYLTYYVNYIMFKNNSINDDVLKLNLNNLAFGITLENNDDSIDDSTINRVFALLQTESIVGNILSLNIDEVQNEKVKFVLKKLNNIDLSIYKIEGLDLITNLFRPLYQLNDVRTIVDSFDRNLKLEKEIDYVLGAGSYTKICSRIEGLNNKILSSSQNSNYYYDLSLEYLAIRNNFIKRYIALKSI